jgi:hypothetical protein
MFDESQPQGHIEEPPNLLRRRGRSFLVVLRLVGGDVYAWANIGTLVQPFAREAPDGTGDTGDSALAGWPLGAPDILNARLKSQRRIC